MDRIYKINKIFEPFYPVNLAVGPGQPNEFGRWHEKPVETG
jgi:hypothetical protein